MLIGNSASIALRLSEAFATLGSCSWRSYMRTLRSCLVLLMVLSLALPALGDDKGFSLADFEKSVTEFTLANGMKFIVVERHQVPVVAFNLYVDVGAVDESSGLTGVSHLF